MKKLLGTFLFLVLLLLVSLTSCNSSRICDICGEYHPTGTIGSPHPSSAFTVFSGSHSESLSIFVDSCWVSLPPDLRLHFIARYDITGLYEAISVAGSNVPFGVTFDGETIMLTTDMQGLEEVSITYSLWQPGTGFAYTIRRMSDPPEPPPEPDLVIPKVFVNDRLYVYLPHVHPGRTIWDISFAFIGEIQSYNADYNGVLIEPENFQTNIPEFVGARLYHSGDYLVVDAMYPRRRAVPMRYIGIEDR